MTVSAADIATTVSREVFGAVLVPQGRGYYVTLELLALAWGTSQTELGVLPAYSESEPLTVRRRGHDFARRWMAGNSDDITEDDTKYVAGEGAQEVLRALLASLRVPIPNRRSLPGWGGQHLYPYVGELVHYDAVPRGKSRRPSIEMVHYRGGGGLAHKMLRTDDDPDRLARNRRGIANLVADSEGPLGKLATACTAHDGARPKDFEDTREQETQVHLSEWVELLRTGVANITGRPGMARAKRVELLMHFVPFCIARHQLDLASATLDEDKFTFPVAQVTRTSPVRAVSRKEFDRARGVIDRALRQSAADLQAALPIDEVDAFQNAAMKRTWRNNIVGFFSATMATAGCLNAHSGSRHVTLRLPLLEALVCASLAPGEEIEFDAFCVDILAGRLGLVADRRSASAVGLTARVDAGEFLENEAQLAQDLGGLGMLREYSDATRLVHGEVS